MLSVALLALALNVSAEPIARSNELAEEIIPQLGHPSFKVREKASAEIEKLGSAALEPLRKGLKHPDAEVGERCRKLLPHALDCRVQEQIEVFLAKPDGPIPADLPGIDRWLK